MTDGPIWFEQRRAGLGGRPATWQGWLLTIGFVAMVIAVSQFFPHRPLTAAAITVPLLILFTVVVARTTCGGLRWRWGSED